MLHQRRRRFLAFPGSSRHHCSHPTNSPSVVFCMILLVHVRIDIMFSYSMLYFQSLSLSLLFPCSRISFSTIHPFDMIGCECRMKASKKNVGKCDHACGSFHSLSPFLPFSSECVRSLLLLFSPLVSLRTDPSWGDLSIVEHMERLETIRSSSCVVRGLEHLMSISYVVVLSLCFAGYFIFLLLLPPPEKRYFIM